MDQVLDRLARDEIDRLLRHNAPILDLDVPYFGGDLLQNIGIKGSLHSTEGGPRSVTTSAIAVCATLTAYPVDSGGLIDHGDCQV
jgi:hypothetical protein